MKMKNIMTILLFVLLSAQIVMGNDSIISFEPENNDIKCIMQPYEYKYKFCSDGYIKFHNNYKIIHYTDINHWMQHSNNHLQIQGMIWYDIYSSFVS
jgi:hypothetical protein